MKKTEFPSAKEMRRLAQRKPKLEAAPDSFDTEDMFRDIKMAAQNGRFQCLWDYMRFHADEAEALDELGYDWEVQQRSPTSRPQIVIFWLRR